MAELNSLVKDKQSALDAAKADAQSQKEALAQAEADASEAQEKVRLHSPELLHER